MGGLLVCAIPLLSAKFGSQDTPNSRSSFSRECASKAKSTWRHIFRRRVGCQHSRSDVPRTHRKWEATFPAAKSNFPTSEPSSSCSGSTHELCPIQAGGNASEINSRQKLLHNVQLLHDAAEGRAADFN